MTGRDYLQQITIGVTEAGVATKVADAITALLRKRHAEPIATTRGARVGALGGLQGPAPRRAAAGAPTTSSCGRLPRSR